MCRTPTPTTGQDRTGSGIFLAQAMSTGIDFPQPAEERRPGPGSSSPNTNDMAGKKRSSKKGANKTFASRRTLNPGSGGGRQSAAGTSYQRDQEHEIPRKLGNFEGRGEHSRTGSRGHQ